MKLHVNDIVAFGGTDYRVESVVAYRLPQATLDLARIVGAGQVRFLEMRESGVSDRALVLSEIDNLDITTPPPATIYHHGESYLQRMSGRAAIEATGDLPALAKSCLFWRYRAAGDQFLQIEEWPDRIRMLAGPSVHVDMLEVRPARRTT
jgi:Domain of unknown function (DUF4178)